MNKKLAISLVLLIEALVYLFLLGVMPILEGALICPTCNVRESFAQPLMILYFVPGLIGLLLIVLIWKQRKETRL